MKTDLDRLMTERTIDTMLVTGPAQHNPYMVYLTGGGHLTQAELIKKRGEEPVLFHQPMEREEAARTGLVTRNMTDYPYLTFLKEAQGDHIQAKALRYRKMLVDMGVDSGSLVIYGSADAGESFAVFSRLQDLMPRVTLVGESSDAMLLEAMATKDEHEIERIRQMGKITTEVVGLVADFLTSQKTKNEVLVKADGSPLTIGDVKRKINLWLAERGAENPEGTIFALGHDAGVPHSTGNPRDYLRLGKTIVFDIFPCEAGGGYFYDFTRTWCLGYATDEVLAIYEDVYWVYQQMMSELELNRDCVSYQEKTCDLFEKRGHPTIRSNPKTDKGYVHSLGHGVGLHIHERPWFGRGASQGDIIEPGVVFTIEPGLYYPEDGMGCRLENTVWAQPNGKMEVLAEFPLDLVYPMNKK